MKSKASLMGHYDLTMNSILITKCLVQQRHTVYKGNRTLDSTDQQTGIDSDPDTK